jgi:hypothetical protein
MALSILEVHSEYRFNQDRFADLTCVSYLPLYYQVLVIRPLMLALGIDGLARSKPS